MRVQRTPTPRIGENQLSGSTWTATFYGYDGHGNVRFLASSTGAVGNTYQFDAFGMPVLCTGYVVREFRKARQGFGEDPAVTDEPERFTGSRLPADLVHIWGTDGHNQRLERRADWKLLDNAA